MNHALFHQSNRGPAVNEAPTTGPRAKKGVRAMDPDTTVPRRLGHYDTVKALRAWGHTELADDLVRVLTDRCLDNEAALLHIEGLLAEARA